MTDVFPDFDLRAPGILIVDDSARVRTILGRRLRRRGFAVYETAGGAEAVEAYGRHPGIELALIDVAMPGMDGPGTLTALRRLDPLARCCFLVENDDDDMGVEELMDLGVELVLSKSLGLAGIDRIVSELVGAAETGEFVHVGNPGGEA